jgi:hypothetical protein
MALQLNLTSDKTAVGVACPAAYARIVQLQFDTKTGKVDVAVDIHADKASRDAGKSPVSGGVYSGVVGKDMPNLDDSIPGVRSALYAYLKTLPDFAGAVDV